MESWLRMNKIPYDTVYTLSLGPKGKIPYIKFQDGQSVGDSNILISMLKERYGADCDSGLTKEQRATARAVTVMLEEHTTQIIFWWRYVKNVRDFVRVTEWKKRILTPPLNGRCLAGPYMCLVQNFLPREFGDKFKKRGLAAHSEQEVIRFSNEDLKAVSDLLGEGPFFFGEQATTIDCTLYGNLVNFLLVPMDFPQKDFVNSQCPNLVKFMGHFRTTFWPDWEEKCTTPTNI